MPYFNKFGQTFFHLVSVFLFWFAATETSAQTSPHKELIEQLNKVAAGLEEAGEADAALRQSLVQLSARIDTALNPTAEEVSTSLNQTAAAIRGNLDNEGISDAVADLRAAVFDYEDARRDQFLGMLADTVLAHTANGVAFVSDGTRSKVRTLESVIGQLDLLSIQDSIAARATTLAGMIELSGPVANGTAAIPALTSLRKVLESIDRNLFYSALDNRVALMDELLKPPAEITKVLRLSDIAKLTDLRATIDAVVPGDKTQKPGVFIISARYGRLSGPANGGSCDVRAAMAKQCHGNISCSLPTAGTGAFCGGEDPAPFAESRHKGTSVTYACLNLTDQQWTEQFSRRPSSFQGITRHDVLRSAGDAIQCGFE
ncbi:hypothetical protein [uncultured Roseobacter sp.]|uniref:hypothetical protein n=1 Tax=uncultured Roseobacter sp. TaxID=114847 RepID=UPI00261BE732|nr:hypothetical protein [uncultured Roseobacter sp.]